MLESDGICGGMENTQFVIHYHSKCILEAVARVRSNTPKPSFEISTSNVWTLLVEEVRPTQNANYLFVFVYKIIKKP